MSIPADILERIERDGRIGGAFPDHRDTPPSGIYRSKDTFGSPKLKDPTAATEELIEEVANEAKTFVDTEAPKVMNRTPGLVPVKEEDQIYDWQMGMRDPNFWIGKIQPFLEQGDSPDLAAWKVLKYHNEMIKKVRG